MADYNSGINFPEIKISTKISYVSENSAYSENYSAIVQGKVEVSSNFERKMRKVKANLFVNKSLLEAKLFLLILHA